MLVPLVRRLANLVWGADLDPALRPLIVVTIAGTIAGSAGWTFVGIWAVEELHARSWELGVYFAVAAAAASYLGGHLSDHVGRRPLILTGWALQALLVLAYAAVGGRLWL